MGAAILAHARRTSPRCLNAPKQLQIPTVQRENVVLGYLWRNFVAERVADQCRLEAARLEAQIAAAIEALRTEIRETAKLSNANAQATAEQLERLRQAASTLFLPVHGILPPSDGPYMAYSTCSAGDMKNRQYVDFCEAAGVAKVFHRKHWEWAFITHHLQRLGAIGPGRRGIVFGVGTEALPSFFASKGAQIVATDAPPEIGEAKGWAATNQFIDSVEGLWRECNNIDRATFMQRVSYETCDMTAIPAHLIGFDFCWSSCCFEHLGSLQAGLDFVVNSVEKTLLPGGIAVHTTEFNLSSNDETVGDGPTVLYRKRDLEDVIRTLRDRGHEVDDLRVAPDIDPLDFYVDAPPYHTEPHLKLRLMGYTSTSVGLVIRRGPIAT